MTWFMVESTTLEAGAHPILSWLLYATVAAYILALFATLIRPRVGGFILGFAIAIHLAAMVGRGLVIEFFPLTNKLESFSSAALGIGLVAMVGWRNERLYGALQLAFAVAAMGVALTFSMDMSYPPPLLRTVWYPLHVPLSFLAFGTWIAAAAAAVCWFRDREVHWLEHVDHQVLWGLGLWSLSMVFGGVWGVVAWGAYFLWDPKVIWSVILWFHYASFLHVRLTPSLRQRRWVRPAFALLGVVWIFVAYVGTSFFFGKSSHAF